MVRDFVPERFTVTGALTEVVTAPTATRGQALQALWQFVQAHSTPDPADPATVLADEALQRVLGLDAASPRLALHSVSSAIDDFLQPTAPITLEYTVQVQVRGEADTARRNPHPFTRPLPSTLRARAPAVRSATTWR